MITSVSKYGIKRHVIYNEKILMVDKDDKLSFLINEQTVNLNLNFIFSEEGEKFQTSGSISEDKKTIDLTLHQWDDPNGVEVTKPIEISDESGKIMWLKFKTTTNKDTGFRSFHLTIWGEE